MAGPTGSIQGKLIKLVPKELTHITITSSTGFTRVGYYGSSSSDFYTSSGERFNIPGCDYLTITYGKKLKSTSPNLFSEWATLGPYSVSDLLNNPQVITWTYTDSGGGSITCKVRMGVIFGEVTGGGAGGSGSWDPRALTLKFVGHTNLGYIIPRFYKYFLDV